MPPSSAATPLGPPGKVTIPLNPFKIAIPDTDIEELHTLLRLGRITRGLFENKGSASDVLTARDYGVRREWLIEAREEWLKFDW